jgi:transposase
MSNVLKVSIQETIRSLYEKGWSQRRIAAELGVNRRTVGRYSAKCTRQVTPGSKPKCTKEVTPGSAVRGRSQCEEYAEMIEAKVDSGLSAQRIWQDLVSEHGFAGSYQAVKRFVRRFKERRPKRVWRMECAPGEEMQVDFGLGAMIELEGGKRRRSWVLRVVLSHSRKGYSEAVYRQDTETFLRCLENALRYFGGVPQLLNVDNLKAAVLKADWFDPELNPKLADFCAHYGLSVLPCRPRTPQHKGKVERGVGYVRNNALKGRRFASLAEENRHLGVWEANIADKRIHGTTRKQVAALFEEECPHLQPLPKSLFPCYQEGRRTVGRDSFVEVEKAFYEAPAEYIGRRIWVRWDGRCVRFFNDRLDQIQAHTRLEPGRFSRILGVCGMSGTVRSSCRWWVDRAGLIGPAAGQWAQNAIETRGPEALRVVMGLCNLSKQHSAAAIEAGCHKAIAAGVTRLKDLKRLIDAPCAQEHFSFAESHPLIRDLKAYGDFIENQQQQPHIHEPSTDQKPRQGPEALGAA